MTEKLFEIAIEAHNRDSEDLFWETDSLLLSWAFKGGRHLTGWNILEKSLCGLATLTIKRGNAEEGERLRISISQKLSMETAPSQEIRDRTAREIRLRAANLDRLGHWSSSIENAMSRTDHGQLRPLLEDISNLLSPGTGDEALTREFL